MTINSLPIQIQIQLFVTMKPSEPGRLVGILPKI